jgi:hypothetical protein
MRISVFVIFLLCCRYPVVLIAEPPNATVFGLEIGKPLSLPQCSTGVIKIVEQHTYYREHQNELCFEHPNWATHPETFLTPIPGSGTVWIEFEDDLRHHGQSDKVAFASRELFTKELKWDLELWEAKKQQGEVVDKISHDDGKMTTEELYRKKRENLTNETDLQQLELQYELECANADVKQSNRATEVTVPGTRVLEGTLSAKLIDGTLYSLILKTPGTGYQRIAIDILTRLYGQPKKAWSTAEHNAFNAEIVNRHATWSVNGMSIAFDGMTLSTEEGQIEFRQNLGVKN